MKLMPSIQMLIVVNIVNDASNHLVQPYLGLLSLFPQQLKIHLDLIMHAIKKEKKSNSHTIPKWLKDL